MAVTNLRTIEETAAQVKHSPYTVRQWAKQRQHLAFVRIGHRLYVDQTEIDRFLAQQTQQPEEFIASGRSGSGVEK
jgi:hypothetical protein